MILAFAGDARTHDLRQAIDVEDLTAQLLLDLSAHSLRAGLCTQNGSLQVEIDSWTIAFLNGLIGDNEGVGRSAGQDIGAEVVHEAHLALSVAGRHRQHRTTCDLAASMGAKTTGEQAVAIGNLQNAALTAISGMDPAGKAVGPLIEVVLSVANNAGRARGAGGAMNTGDFLTRNREHIEGIGIAQILLHREGELRKIGKARDIRRGYTSLVERLLVERNAIVNVLGQVLKSLKLQLLELRTRHRL